MGFELRGFEEAASILSEGFVGVLVRDGWGVYRRFLAAEHQTCLAHLLRRCHEMRELAWGRAHEVPRLVGGILSDALALRDLRDFEDIEEAEFQLQLTALEDRMDQLLARPAIRQTANRRLLDHLRRERDHLFTFLHRPGVEATNWQAEQGLRPAVVNRKVWGGNRTWPGAATQERLMSVLRSCRQQALDPIRELTELQRLDAPALLGGLAIPACSALDPGG